MSKKVRCEKCGGTGKEARIGLFDSTKGYPQEVDMTVDCLDCKGTGQVELTDKTFHLGQSDQGEIKRG